MSNKRYIVSAGPCEGRPFETQQTFNMKKDALAWINAHYGEFAMGYFRLEEVSTLPIERKTVWVESEVK